MSTYLAAAGIDLAPGAPFEPVLTRLRNLVDDARKESHEEALDVVVTTAPDLRHRVLLYADYGIAWVGYMVRDLLAAQPEIDRAIVAEDGDEYMTENFVLRGGGAATIVHCVRVIDAANWPEGKRPTDTRPLACGLARTAGPGCEVEPGDGPRARAAVAALFGIPVERMEAADRALDTREDLALQIVYSTYGMWWDAVGMPWPGDEVDQPLARTVM